jgi:hypothetical protein
MLVVIARSEATKQSILSLRGSMDCFASLAMTRNTQRDREAVSANEQPLDARQYRNTPPQLDEMA